VKQREEAVSTIRILLADDHAVLRQGTRQLLAREEDLEVVAEAGDGEEAVRLARVHAPDIVIMDIAMPKLNGIEATRRILYRSPHIAILMLTMFDDDASVFAAVRAGARPMFRADPVTTATRPASMVIA
jgi:DNA-binding NarL/FixJ family response regulator